MADRKTTKRIVRARDWYCNIPIMRIERDGSVVYAYLGDKFAGMFDLGSVDVLYITETREV